MFLKVIALAPVFIGAVLAQSTSSGESYFPPIPAGSTVAYGATYTAQGYCHGGKIGYVQSSPNYLQGMIVCYNQGTVPSNTQPCPGGVVYVEQTSTETAFYPSYGNYVFKYVCGKLSDFSTQNNRLPSFFYLTPAACESGTVLGYNSNGGSSDNPAPTCAAKGSSGFKACPSVKHGTVTAQTTSVDGSGTGTCLITCDTGYNLSGNKCVAAAGASGKSGAKRARARARAARRRALDLAAM